MTFPARDPRHGTTNGYGNLKCRCRRCTAAFRVAHHEYASRPDRREWILSQRRARAHGAQNPQERSEWQEAVDGAHVLLLIDSAVQYGLIETDMQINIRRCEELLAEGARRRAQAATGRCAPRRMVRRGVTTEVEKPMTQNTAEAEAEELRAIALVTLRASAQSLEEAHARRDRAVRAAARLGLSSRAIAEAVGLSHPGVMKIVKREDPPT